MATDFLKSNLPWFIAAAGLALLALCTGGASAANTPPMEGCGPMSLEAQTALLNNTTGLQDEFFSTNITICDVEDAASTLAYTMPLDPPSPWSLRPNATGNLELYSYYTGNEFVGVNAFNLTLCDSEPACTNMTFHITIVNINEAPHFGATGGAYHTVEDELYTLDLEVTDPDNDIPGVPPTVFTFSDDTDWFDVSPAGIISFTPTNDLVQENTVWVFHVGVTDDGTPQLSAQLDVWMRVFNTNDPPVLAPIDDMHVAEGHPALGPLLYAADDDIKIGRQLASWPDEVNFTMDCPIGTVVTVNNGRPILDPPAAVGQVAVTATNDQVGTWTCSVAATDTAGANSTQSFRIIVENVNNHPWFVRVDLREDTTGQARNITETGQVAPFSPATLVHFKATFEDPDLDPRTSPGGGVVDPNETMECSVNDTYEGTAVPGGGGPERAWIDPATCEGELDVSWIEWGIVSLRIRAAEKSGGWSEVLVKVNITNAASCHPVAQIAQPRQAFRWEAQQRADLRSTARCTGNAIAELRYEWRVTIAGGRNYTVPGQNVNLTVWNDLSRQAQVTVMLTVTAEGDNRATQTTSVFTVGTINANFNARPLVARPSGAPVNLPGSLSVAFAPNVEGGLSPYAFYWDFGDGRASQEAMPVHAYGAEGNYTVTVTVTDATGFAATHAIAVQVVEQHGNTGALWGIMFSLAAVAGITVAGMVALMWKRDGPS